MRWIAAALVLLSVTVGLILFWPGFEGPELLLSPGKETTPTAPTAPTIYQQTSPLVVRSVSNSIEGKGMPVNLDDFSNRKAGDEISIFVPQEDSVHQGIITKVSTTESGNRVITGFLGSKHRFVFTVGKFQTFGTIQTQSGRYQMEARDGAGRIVSVKAINEGLDFSQPDYVVPERKVPPSKKPDKEERG